MAKKQIHILASTEKNKKDSDIEVTTDYYADSDSDSAIITKKFSAKLNGVSANGFYTKEDAVTELNRKFKLGKNNINNLKTEIMKKSIEELKHNLELAKKSISKKCVIEDNILFVSLRNKINELESEIKHYDHAPKRDVAVTHKPLAVKKDIPVKHVEPKHAPSKPIVHEKKVVKKEVPARSANLPTASSNKEINKILDMEVARHQKHYRLFKLGIPLDEIVELTGATRSNIGRDILQYKKGVLKLS